MVIVKKEDWQDFKDVENLLRQAFPTSEEAILVNKLRLSEAFVPELSLVARMDHQIVGHNMLTRLSIQDGEGVFSALALAPLAVLPLFQRQGYGSRLVKMAVSEATRLGYSLILVLGDPQYYSRFGFVPAVEKGIYPPEESWKDAFQVLELVPGALQNIQGQVLYPPEFSA